jgi:hypothetical protein
VQKGTHADGVHAASWATCVGPGTCNLTQELTVMGVRPPFCRPLSEPRDLCV